MIYYVYTVSDKNDIVFYVGITLNPWLRTATHVRTGSGNRLDVIEEVYSPLYSPTELENYWIDQFRQWGFNLINRNGNLAYDRRNKKT